jgi:hypothetical protein
MIDPHDLLRNSIDNVETPDMDLTFPPEFEGLMDYEKFTELLICPICEYLPCEIESISNMVVKFRNTYHEDTEDGDCELVEDPLPREFDMKPMISKYPLMEHKAWWKMAEYEMYKANRATPLFNYLMKDYLMALDYLYFGWQKDGNILSHSEGFWNAYVEMPLEHLPKRCLIPGISTIIYIQLETFRQYAVTTEMLEIWGVSEDQLFEDILKHAGKLLKPTTEIKKTVFETCEYLTYYTFDREKNEVATLMASLDYWFPESVGTLGNLVAIPEESFGYVFTLDKFDHLFSAISTLAPHLKENFNVHNFPDRPIFGNKLYWVKDGKFYYFKLDYDYENKKFKILMPEEMEPFFRLPIQDEGIDKYHLN